MTGGPWVKVKSVVVGCFVPPSGFVVGYAEVKPDDGAPWIADAWAIGVPRVLACYFGFARPDPVRRKSGD